LTNRYRLSIARWSLNYNQVVFHRVRELPEKPFTGDKSYFPNRWNEFGADDYRITVRQLFLLSTKRADSYTRIQPTVNSPAVGVAEILGSKYS
jgi:hypothetical protein